jgi:replicative DNA helicase
MNLSGPLLVGDRPLPHAKLQEIAVLSCIMQDPAAVWPVVAACLQEDDFYIPHHRRLWCILADMCQRDAAAVDTLGLMDYATSKGCMDELGGEEFLRDVYNAIPTTALAETYITAVSRYGDARRLIRLATDAVGRLYEATDVELPAVVNEVQSELMLGTVRTNEEREKSMAEMIAAAVQNIIDVADHKEHATGIPTGFRGLDRKIMGLRGGELIVIAARPSIGKTAFAVQMAMQIAYAKHPVLVQELEMSGESLIKRLLTSYAGIDMSHVYDHGLTSQNLVDIEDVSITLNDSPLHIRCMDKNPTSDRIIAQIRRYHAQYGIKVAVLDYLQLVSIRSNNRQYNREQEVAQLSGELKRLAQQLDIPIVVLAQLNRMAEGGRPKISHLRESGAIEQDADMILLLHRDRETDSHEIARQIAQGGTIPAEILIGKNRHGATGICKCEFAPKYTRFDDPKY